MCDGKRGTRDGEEPEAFDADDVDARGAATVSRFASGGSASGARAAQLSLSSRNSYLFDFLLLPVPMSTYSRSKHHLS